MAIEHDIYILDAIVPDLWAQWGFGVSAKMIKKQLEGLKGDETLNIFINCHGGAIDEGTSIYYLLKGHKGAKNVTVIGIAASMGSVIALAGDSVKIGLGAKFMIHNPLSGVRGNAEEMRKEADVLDKYAESIIQIYLNRTKLTRDQLLEKMSANTYLTAQESVEFGFADSILETEPPKYQAVVAALEQSAITAFNLIFPTNETPETENSISNKQTFIPMKEITAFLGLSEGATESNIRAAIEKRIADGQLAAQAEIVKKVAEKHPVSADLKEAFDDYVNVNPVKALTMLKIDKSPVQVIETAHFEQVVKENKKGGGDGGLPVELTNLSFDELSKNHSAVLLKLKRENPEAFEKLYNASYKN